MKNFLEIPVAHRNLINSKILETSVSIIGTGHLGSWVANGLSLIGATEFYLYDYDIVEDRNISGTPYQSVSIGKPKVDELKNLMEMSSVGKRFILTRNKKLEKAKDIVQDTEFYIIATDSLESRQSVFNAIVKVSKNSFLIDMRSRAKISEIYSLPLENEIAKFWYKENLKSNEKDPTPPIHCNEANIVQNSLLASSVTIQIVSDVLDGCREARYFRLGIDKFSIQPVTVPLESYEKEYNKIKKKQVSRIKLRECIVCSKKHRKASLFERCKAKQKVDKNKGLPDRSALFKK